jgi:hypothetical protein
MSGMEERSSAEDDGAWFGFVVFRRMRDETAHGCGTRRKVRA